MPGFDGTGPRGQGPMTGKAQGFCLLEVADDARKADTGDAVLPGRQDVTGSLNRQTETFQLQLRLQKVRLELDRVKCRLTRLDEGGGK